MRTSFLLSTLAFLPFAAHAADAGGCGSTCRQPPSVCVHSCDGYHCEHGGIENFQKYADNCGFADFTIKGKTYSLAPKF